MSASGQKPKWSHHKAGASARGLMIALDPIRRADAVHGVEKRYLQRRVLHEMGEESALIFSGLRKLNDFTAPKGVDVLADLGPLPVAVELAKPLGNKGF